MLWSRHYYYPHFVGMKAWKRLAMGPRSWGKDGGSLVGKTAAQIKFYFSFWTSYKQLYFYTYSVQNQDSSILLSIYVFI